MVYLERHVVASSAEMTFASGMSEMRLKYLLSVGLQEATVLAVLNS